MSIAFVGTVRHRTSACCAGAPPPACRPPSASGALDLDLGRCAAASAVAAGLARPLRRRRARSFAHRRPGRPFEGAGSHARPRTARGVVGSGPADGADGADDVARRGVVAAAASAALGVAGDSALRAGDERYALAGTILPPAPYKETLRTELVPGCIWGFEQCIALFSVSTNIRMTAVRLLDGTLWVSAPISPTRQCLRLLDELGEVAHLVVPSTALEHRASLGEFARAYPRASVWVTPGQAAAPPGAPAGSRVLGRDAAPWAGELELKLFFVEPPVTETFAEAAFFHRRTGTLLVTDCALRLPREAPRVLESYGYDGAPGPISPEQWRYKAIAFDFVSARGRDEADFEALARPPALVNPLLRFLVYRRCPRQAAAWVEDVARWPFARIVPAHLQAPFDCTPEQFLEAFGFLFGRPTSWEPEDEQLAFLRFLREQVGGPAF